MKRWIVAAGLAAWTALAGPGGAAVHEIGWTTTLAGALDTAKQDRRPVLVDVWAVWCVPCKEMERTTYADPQVVAAVNEGFVPLKVDADVHEAFVERYGVDAFPTLLFLDHEGNEISRMRGLVAAPELLARVGPVAAGYAGYMQARQAEASAGDLQRAAAYLVTAGNADGAVQLLKRGNRGRKKAPAAEREAAELALGLAQLAADDPRAAAKTFRKLDVAETGDATRTEAQRWLARCAGDDAERPAAAAQRLSGSR